MTRTEIYNIALGRHGKKCTEAEVKSNNPPYEVQLCHNYYDAAVQKVMGENDGSLMVRRVDVKDCDDEPMGRWKHGFTLPPFINRVSPLSTKPYQVIDRHFYTNEDEPDIFVIPSFFESEIAPDPICQLVGLALAYELCGILAPADNAIATLILQNYSWILQPLISSEATSHIRSVEEGGPVDI